MKPQLCTIGPHCNIKALTDLYKPIQRGLQENAPVLIFVIMTGTWCQCSLVPQRRFSVFASSSHPRSDLFVKAEVIANHLTDTPEARQRIMIMHCTFPTLEPVSDMCVRLHGTPEER